jgi:alpha-tubulin suppressor-like RCC1 family protein
VASWGDNSFGELGDGTVTSRPLYRDIAAGSDVAQAAAGRTHNLALRSDGTVSAWGLITNIAGATQVAAGQLASYAVHTVLVLAGQSS